MAPVFVKGASRKPINSLALFAALRSARSMDDFSMYHIHNTDIDWHAIQPTFFNGTQNTAKTMDNEGEEKIELDEPVEIGENTRPVSAYAMFFKERQIFAKLSCPHATFGDISRFVAAEWDALGKQERMRYKTRTDRLRKMQIKMAVKERVERIRFRRQETTSSTSEDAPVSGERQIRRALAERQHVVYSDIRCQHNKH